MKSILVIAALFVAWCGSAQNVGINTKAPVHALTVRQDGIGIAQESADSSTRIGFYTTGGAAFLQTHTNHDLNLSTGNGSAKVTLQKNTGNLGIGTTNPQAKLDVAGAVRIADGTQGDKRVLTSDAQGLARWQAAAFTNTERVAATSSCTAAGGNAFKIMYNTGRGMTVTNYNSGNDSLKTRGIYVSVAKAGLYHFKINGNGGITENCQISTSSMTVYLIGAGNVYLNTMSPAVCDNPATNMSTLFTINTDIDVYLQPGYGYLFQQSISATPKPGFNVLTILGYLVSE